jgi:hypothetical protein
LKASETRGAAAAARGIILAVLIAGLGRPAFAEPVVVVDSARFGNVFEASDVPELFVRTTADSERGLRGRVRIVAHDAYGTSAGRLTFPVNLRPGETDVHSLVLQVRHLGYVTVVGGLDGAGGRLAKIDTSAAVVPDVDESIPAEQSGAGYFVLPFDSELPMADDIAAEMRRLGIRWVRLLYGWWMDDRPMRPDTSDPTWLDSTSFERWVDAYRSHGIEVLGVLFGTARWASSAIDDVTPLAGIPRWGLVIPRDMADWELFVRTLAGRVQGRVTSWEIWNEPDIPVFWTSSPQDFMQLTRSSATVLREVDPQMRIVLNLVDRETPYGLGFRDVVLGGASDLLDVFGYHYGGAEFVAAARAIQPLLRPDATLWNTETYGAPRRHVTRWLEQRTLGMERLFPFIYHTIFDDADLPAAQRFGTYPVNLDYTPRPDGVAFRTLSDLVGSAAPLRGGPAGFGYSVFTFDTPGGPTVALADLNELGPTWRGRPGIALRLRVPPAVERVELIDLMGNRRSQRVHGGQLDIRVLGVATFLRSEPPDALTEIRVVHAHRLRRRRS